MGQRNEFGGIGFSLSQENLISRGNAISFQILQQINLDSIAFYQFDELLKVEIQII